eukprot:scaffold52407_cov21-Tisochrysis_lutea.AAC.1
MEGCAHKLQEKLQMMAKRVPNIETLVQILGKKKLLPVIWFILSRKCFLFARSRAFIGSSCVSNTSAWDILFVMKPGDCDLATVKAGSGAYSLTTESEQAAIKHE